jgi:hypothetical protein
MKRYLAFVAIGSAFATVEEFLTVVVLRHDLPSYLFTLIILFPVYLTIVFFSSDFLDRLTRPRRELGHLITFGCLGLALEWTLMGLAPWSNPDANPLAMFGFQLGMFAFWATVATAPRQFLDPRSRAARRRIVRLFTPYMLLTYFAAFSVPDHAKFATIIVLILVGYLVVTGLLISEAARLDRSNGKTREPGAE